MQKQKGFIQIALLAVIILIVVGSGVYYIFAVRKNVGGEMPEDNGIAQELQVNYQGGATNAPSIKSGIDLNKAAADLDGTDLNQIDKDLDSLSSDSSTF